MTKLTTKSLSAESINTKNLSCVTFSGKISKENIENFGDYFSTTDTIPLSSIENGSSIITSLDGVEKTENKVTSVLSDDTDEQIPTAKAVYDLVKSLTDRVEELESQVSDLGLS